jgi:hypothetical protein
MNIKNTSDSNKENLTPLSMRNSVSKYNNNPYNENTLKILSEQKDFLSHHMENSDSDYFRLIKKKEELTSQVMEKDSQIFKLKADLEYVLDDEREKLLMKNKLEENFNQGNLFIENEIISKNLGQLQISNKSDCIFSLKNDFLILGQRQRDGINFNKFIKNQQGSQSLNEYIEKTLPTENENIKAFMAYNII